MTNGYDHQYFLHTSKRGDEMMNQDLTRTVNTKIGELKAKVNGLPPGGGFESLRVSLGNIQSGVDEFVLVLDEIEIRRCDEA